jgi:hypothetical protein
MSLSNLPIRSSKISTVFYALAIMLIVIGLVSWFRLPEPSVILYPSHGDAFTNDNGVAEVGPRSDLCSALNEPSGYLLISGSIDLTNIGLDQGFFQTADEENGIYLDIDGGGQVRLGVHLNDETTGQVMFRHKYRTGLFNYAILIGADSSIRIVGDQNDIRVQMNEIEPTCSNLRIGAGNETEAVEAQVVANISSGNDLEMANANLDSYVDSLSNNQNASTYKLSLYTGILLLMFLRPTRTLLARRRIK